MKIKLYCFIQSQEFKKWCGIILLVGASLWGGMSCAPRLPDVKIDYSDPRVCYCGMDDSYYPVVCKTTSKDFNFRIRLSREGQHGRYLFEGTAQVRDRKDAASLKMEGNANRFYLYLIRDSAFVDCISLKISDNMYHGVLRLETSFTTDKEFDAVAIDYSVKLKDSSAHY